MSAALCNPACQTVEWSSTVRYHRKRLSLSLGSLCVLFVGCAVPHTCCTSVAVSPTECRECDRPCGRLPGRLGCPNRFLTHQSTLLCFPISHGSVQMCDIILLHLAPFCSIHVALGHRCEVGHTYVHARVQPWGQPVWYVAVSTHVGVLSARCRYRYKPTRSFLWGLSRAEKTQRVRQGTLTLTLLLLYHAVWFRCDPCLPLPSHTLSCTHTRPQPCR